MNPNPNAELDVGPPDASSPLFSLVDITKRFRTPAKTDFTVLSGVSLSIRLGEFIAIIGPSGCGKSTLLRIAAGFTRASSGQVIFRGKELHGMSRDIGFVTQDSNLFPWLRLKHNVGFALKARKWPKAARRDRVNEYIALARLTGFEESFPKALSGGMQKRASIVRTLVYEPPLMLMDEPFGALDAQTKTVLQRDLLDLWNAYSAAVIFVTHDLTEAVLLADRVLVMGANPGRIVAEFAIPLARPRDVFELQNTQQFVELRAAIWERVEAELAVE